MTELAHWGTYEYFKQYEFLCPCCGEEYMQHEFLKLLDAVRHKYGRMVRVNSGYRCPDHNATVSSTGRTGPHTTGCAADLGVSGSDAYYILTLAAQNGGFTGIGVNQRGNHASRFIHLDSLPTSDPLRPWVWSY